MDIISCALKGMEMKRNADVNRLYNSLDDRYALTPAKSDISGYSVDLGRIYDLKNYFSIVFWV